MRLIDADALNKELKKRVGPPDTKELYDVNLAIIDAPTVEVKFNFAQTMHDWKRMCDWHEKKYGDKSCDYCSVTICSPIFDMPKGYDWHELEQTITAWAEEHPEPEFPTWYDYLCNIGVLNGCGTSADVLAALTELHISPAIAERIGLSPE